jgi:hypothetical protein
MLGSPHDRLETDKALTPTTKSLQIAHFGSTRPDAPEGSSEVASTDKGPANPTNHGARGTRTPDLLGAIQQLCSGSRREKLPISRGFAQPHGKGHRPGMVADRRRLP